MPDADDFDVEYFRSLLKGNQPPERAAAPAARTKPARPASKPAAAKAKRPPAAGGKKGGKR